MKRLRWVVLAVVVVALIIVGIRIYTNVRWFEEVGYTRVYWMRLAAGWGLGIVAGIGFFFFLRFHFSFFLQVLVNYGPTNRERHNVIELAPSGALSPAVARRIAFWFSLVIAILLGISFAGNWPKLLQWLYATPFGESDPVFGHDVSFYMQVLPFWKAVLNYLNGVNLALAILLTIGYAVLGAWTRDELFSGERPLTKQATFHALLVWATFFGLQAIGIWLGRFGFLQSNNGTVLAGAGYTDIHARLPMQWVRLVFSAMIALFFVAMMRRGAWRRFILPAVGGYLVVLIITAIYPALLQQFSVTPNEATRERPYIARNIAWTRRAYDIDAVTTHAFPARNDLTYQDVTSETDVVRNIRLLDIQPAQEAFTQLEALRYYYSFTNPGSDNPSNLDMDRYPIGGKMTEVILAPRELDVSKIPAQGQTWVNLHERYTHGNGVVMAPVGQVTSTGDPVFIAHNIPVQSEIPITQPRIYYGEQTSEYVIANTKGGEFDAPSGEGTTTNHYEGTGGIPMTWYNRLFYSASEGTLRLLLSNDITAESRLMIHRVISDRVATIAPFLYYDRNPYMVIADGKLYWIQDAYTMGSGYPYATSESANSDLNYVRNSIKIVIDAYNGTVTFYQVDFKDPLATTYNHMYGGIFQPLDAMPAALRAHLRYPEDLFGIQTNMLNLYHMTDPMVFYNKEDAWTQANENYSGNVQRMLPYYAVVRLSGQPNAEFVLMQPFTPAPQGQTPLLNLTGWLAARSDPQHYGQLILYEMPKGILVPGPQTFERWIDADPGISQQFTLWNSGGSTVIRGNTLAIPVKDAILYVEPIYLRANGTSSIPEVRQVIVGYNEQVAMRPTLQEALAAVFGAKAPPSTSLEQQAPPAPTTTPTPEVTRLIQQAQQLFNQGQQALRNGDWSGYGQVQQQLQGVLQQLAQAAGGQANPAAQQQQTQQQHPAQQQAQGGR
ncbi:MAG: UPF0182 family protein [Firmicutes bacterium]|nr:UPF0182 family protein [Bacillota bacterium]